MTESEIKQSHGIMQLNKEEWLRAYIVENCAQVLSVDEMHRVYEWLKDGTLPGQKSTKLKAV